MRNYLLVGLLILATHPAAGLAAEEENVTWQEVCENYSKLAETVMENRQQGVAMADMMNALEDNRFAEQLIMAAYEQPRYSTEDMKRRTIEEFSNDWYLQCAKQLRGREQ